MHIDFAEYAIHYSSSPPENRAGLALIINRRPAIEAMWIIITMAAGLVGRCEAPDQLKAAGGEKVRAKSVLRRRRSNTIPACLNVQH